MTFEPTVSNRTLIRTLKITEAPTALDIVNDAAAAAYKGVIPDDCWCEPYMPLTEILEEIAAGVNFWTYAAEGSLLGVMGRQPLGEVTLIRHAYVRPGVQQQGIGAQLLKQLLQGIDTPVLVGTWASAWWAIRFYEKHGFRLVTPAEKNRLLRRYWTISDRQVETSVVLGDEKWFASPLAK
ncbi:MAG: GNAT family N-acetyltransferase [Deltaproteobacteria bacterium]|nr:GNAT family N-acetyltransferase [Deltaproteobacteria bacterium]